MFAKFLGHRVRGQRERGGAVRLRAAGLCWLSFDSGRKVERGKGGIERGRGGKTDSGGGRWGQRATIRPGEGRQRETEGHGEKETERWQRE